MYIENYKSFKEPFSLSFNDGINIIVGDNEAGKSTILEAINLALTGILHGKYLKNELTQYLFNNESITEYLNSLDKASKLPPPKITIEVYFAKCDLPLFEGNGNNEKTKHCGISFKIEFDDEYKDEYEELVKSDETILTLPIEYYKITLKSFARDTISSRSIPIKSIIIDSSSNKYQNGSDVYIARIIKNDLNDKEKIKLSQAYRKMKDGFINDKSMQDINKKINKKADISSKKLHVSADLSTQNSWETVLMTYLDQIPFHQIGKGEQCIIKTNLALGHNKAKEANLILLEEPENHLSHAKLNHLIKKINSNCEGKQVIITTHSSFVANKLGLENLILLNDKKTIRLNKLNKNTYDFFKKLPGYQTLRLLLCKKAVLVEGDSDELVFQKLYMNTHKGSLPIENEIDVISVKLTFKRFLEIAFHLNKPVAVITDNDSDFDKKITKKYSEYSDCENIKIFADDRNNLNTLEPQFVDANRKKIKKLCSILKINKEKYKTVDEISNYMENNKTDWALHVFESEEELNFPKYLHDAVEWCDE